VSCMGQHNKPNSAWLLQALTAHLRIHKRAQLIPNEHRLSKTEGVGHSCLLILRHGEPCDAPLPAYEGL